MANFKKIDKNLNYYKKGEWYTIEGDITEDDIESLNRLDSETIISIQNTKGISSQKLNRIINPQVKISVRGGLDYFEKTKFNAEQYISRTIHSPSKLALVVSKFEKLESKIKDSWNENQKCMYIYKMLAEDLHHKYENESGYDDGREVVNNLEGLISGELVRSGFSIVFKEALDRVGIENVYQSTMNDYSWNVVKINGKYRALDLTSDCLNKKPDNECGFLYYGVDVNFYSNSHHNIDNEAEEKQFSLEPFDIATLNRDFKEISASENKITYEMIQSKDGSFSYTKLNEKDGIDEYVIFLNGSLACIYVDSDLDVDTYFSEKNVNTAMRENDNYIGKKVLDKSQFSSKNYYTRQDGSKFFIEPSSKKGEVHEVFCYQPEQDENGNVKLDRYTIWSENDLVNCQNPGVKSMIAEHLLSKDRLKRKVEHYNGYVGYVLGTEMQQAGKKKNINNFTSGEIE